ncbi:MFS transporter [Thermocrispum agreste]|nr:MFS transporter [Thermocrispum agreste]
MLPIFVGTSVVGVGQTYTVIPLMPAIARDWGIALSATTWLATGFSLSFAIGFLFAGPAADRYGPRKVILVGLLGAAFSTLLVTFAQSLPAAVAFRCLQGVTVAAIGPTATAYLAEHADPRRRPVALGAMSSSGLAAAVVMQVAAQALAPAGWRAIFVASSAAMLLLFAAVLIRLRADTAERANTMTTALLSVPRLLARPRLLALYAATSTLLGSLVIVYTAIEIAGPPAVADNPTALLVLRASSLPAVVVAPFLTGMATRLSPRTKAVLALLVATLGAAAAGLVGGNVILLGLALLLLVGGIAVAAPTILELIHAAAPDAIGTAIALYSAALFVGTSLGPQIAGLATAGGFAAAALTGAALLVVGVLTICAAAGRRRAVRDAPPPSRAKTPKR